MRVDAVRALARRQDEGSARAAIGVESVPGGLADAEEVIAVAKGCDAAIHSAALLGGAGLVVEVTPVVTVSSLL